MSMEKMLLEKFITIKFGKRVFYMPNIVAANISFEGNKINIDMADMDSYIIANGIRCYYCIIYDAETDTVDTWLKDFKLDGIECPQATHFSFSLSDDEFPVGKRDQRMVKPMRNYEATDSFIAENADLDKKIVDFLKNHPDTFEIVELVKWNRLSKQLSGQDFDNSVVFDYLPEPIAEMFCKEEL